jgi:putative CocE/NonD family hydrolase
MTEDIEVTGPVTLELWAKSSAVDTDFTAKLVDVAPDGFATNLADGILRMRYRDSQEKPTLMNPDQIYKVSVDLSATSNVFKKGHLLRLDVSSSNFPRYDRNLRAGRDGDAHASRTLSVRLSKRKTLNSRSPEFLENKALLVLESQNAPEAVAMRTELHHRPERLPGRRVFLGVSR